jgi:hypothetical protein
VNEKFSENFSAEIKFQKIDPWSDLSSSCCLFFCFPGLADFSFTFIATPVFFWTDFGADPLPEVSARTELPEVSARTESTEVSARTETSSRTESPEVSVAPLETAASSGSRVEPSGI